MIMKVLTITKRLHDEEELERLAFVKVSQEVGQVVAELHRLGVHLSVGPAFCKKQF